MTSCRVTKWPTFSGSQVAERGSSRCRASATTRSAGPGCSRGTGSLPRWSAVNETEALELLEQISALPHVINRQLDYEEAQQIGRDHVCTPVTKAHLVCR